MTDYANPSSIFITGASSGIGAALALEYAAAGVHLTLTARRLNALDDIAALCRTAGAQVQTQQLDVCNGDGMAAAIKDADLRAPLDLVVANAGISAGTGGHGETEAQARAIFATNMGGVLNTVFPAVSVMKTRQRGQIAIMSSLAAWRGLGAAPAYAASKAAVKTWGEGLRGALAAEDVAVNVIMPGFVESGITATNDFHMPFFMTADRAARIIRRGLAHNRGRIAFPWPMALAAWMLGTMPDGLAHLLTGRLPAKPSLEDGETR